MEPLFVRDLLYHVFLGIFTLSEIAVILRLKFRIDRSGLITLLIFQVIFLLRSLNSMIHMNNSPEFLLIQSANQSLIWTALYYFTFELRLIYLTVASSSMTVYLICLKYLSRLRKVLIGFILCIYMPLMAA